MHFRVAASAFRVLIFLFLSTLLLTRPAPAAPVDYRGKTVLRVEYDPPNQPYPAEELERMVSVKQAKPLSLDDVHDSIVRLYHTGRYADIDVDARNEDGGVVIRFITRTNFFVGGVKVLGVPEPPPQSILVNTTRFELGALYAEDKTRTALDSLRQTLRSNGFYNSRITPRFTYDRNAQQIFITFEVASGVRARYTVPTFTGDPQQPVDRLIRATRWKRWLLGWREVTEGRTQGGLDRIRRSYQKQDKLMAQVSLEQMDWDKDTNRAKAAVRANAGPQVEITTTGTKLSRGKIRQLVPVYEEQSVDRDLLVEGARNITEYLERQGYFDSEVDFSSKQPKPGTEEIQYEIQRGPRHDVAALVIEGNKYFDIDTIRERMYVRPASFLQFRHGRYSGSLLRNDLDSIRDLYRSNGFRDVEVASRVEHPFQGRDNKIAIHIRIDEGPQWTVSKLALSGVSASHEEAVRGVLQSGEGQPFSDLNAAVDRESILDYYYNEGYPDATFQWSFKPAAAPHEVELTYDIEEGGRKFVREVLQSGLVATNPALVDERITLKAGDPLSRNKMLETQRLLYNLGIFSRVDMALQNPSGDEERKYVLLQMEESNKYTVTGGIGAEIAKIGGSQTTLDEPAGTTGFSPRVNFEVTRRNFLGDGHILSLKTRASTLQNRAVLSYQAPQFQGNPDLNLTFSATYDDSRDVRTFSSKRQEGSVQVGRRLSRANTVLGRFTYRRVSVSNVKIISQLIPLYSQAVRLGILGASFIQDRRDDPTDSTRGVYNTVDAGWASRYFGAQTQFTRILIRNSTYHPFGVGRRYVLARSLSFGWEQPLKVGQVVPLPERFFSGGASTHRGFPENQAGPRDPETGFPLGGQALLMNQIEWRFPLIGENIGGVLFHDAGNVYDRIQSISFRVHQTQPASSCLANPVTFAQTPSCRFDFNYMVHAVGFGIRYRTPVGPLRIDLAYVPNSPRFNGLKGTLQDFLNNPNLPPVLQRISRFQFHFSLGQSF